MNYEPILDASITFDNDQLLLLKKKGKINASQGG